VDITPMLQSMPKLNPQTCEAKDTFA